MSVIIKINNLKKSYGHVSALNGISFDVNKGEMFGIVGPDGAGKTTTLRILCGLLNFDKGIVEILNQDIIKNKNYIQKNIGYLSQKFSLYGDLSVDENIEFFAEIHNVTDYKGRRNELLSFTRLIEFRNRIANNLSGGMKQKLALACSLIHKPQILLLDEPTTGVDPVSRRDFWKILSSLRAEGITILMSTPYLDEAERCTKVAMIDNGEIIALDSPDIIRKSINKEILEIVCKPINNAYQKIKDNLSFDVQMFGDRINIVTDDYLKTKGEVLELLKKDSIDISNIRKLNPSLENVFIYKIKEIS